MHIQFRSTKHQPNKHHITMTINDNAKDKNHQSACDYVAMEWSFHRKEITLQELIDSFNSLNPTERSWLSQSQWEAKKAWLDSKSDTK